MLEYASPPAMVAAVIARRVAGDWRGACAAGLVDPHIDLRDIATRYGAEQAALIEADLLGFAPDLMRRFLPRTDSAALVRRLSVVLCRRPAPLRLSPGPPGPGTPVLVASLPPVEHSPERIALRVRDLTDLRDTDSWIDLPDWCWHADAVAARRWAYGASATRLAWHTAGGRPYRQGESTPPDQPADRASEVETVTALLAAERTVAAYEAAGFTVDTSQRESRYRSSIHSDLARYGPTLPLLAAEARRLARRYGLPRLSSPGLGLVIDVTDGGLTVRGATWDDRTRGPQVCDLRAPLDVALLRWGTLRPDDLHPLVHEALFPGRTQAPPVQGTPARPIRVRCETEWHEVRVTGTRIHAMHHTGDELRREFLLAGLGGPVSGCAAAVRAWRTGQKPVPKEIRKLRQRLFQLAFHGDTDGLLALLAAGVDPEVRNGQGRTLLHYLPHLDHDRMLPVLLDAGYSLEARDHAGGTPLHAAAAAVATATMAALVDRGADPDAVDGHGRTAAEVLAQARRTAGR